uniref:Vacuolar protein sorting-associated protein 33B n=2 Tax=Ciona intestinalis TaxID=7719 RepID=F6VM60_CIOIN
MAGGDYPDVSMLKELAREQLTILLGNFYGKKDLVIDPGLMTPLDRLTGVQFLKHKGVDKIFKLEHKEILGGCDQRVYIVRPQVKSMRNIAAHIHSDKRAGKLRKYRILMVPRRLHVCEMILEQEGVYGSVQIEDLHIGLIPIDSDIISLENPQLLDSFFMEGDYTWLHTVARTIVNLQSTFGTIPNVYGQGHAAKIVETLVQTLTSELGEKKSPLQHKIGHIVLLDRDVDYVTPLCSQVTYEGLLDDIFEIKCGAIEFGPEVTGTEKVAKTMLNSEDAIFSQIRNRHFTGVFKYLSSRAKEIQANYDKRHNMELQELKNFVSEELKGLKQEHRSLTLHIGASEVIMKHKTKGSLKRGDLQDILGVEHNLLEGSDFRQCVSYIEECIHRQYDMLLTLRLLCLLSCTTSGLLAKDYQSLKLKFLHSYGFEHMITFFNLKKAGLLTEAVTGKEVAPSSIESNLNKLADSRGVGSAVSYVTSSLAALQKKDWFRTVSKKLSLIPKAGVECNLQNPNDMSYVFGGAYTPLTCRLVEQAIQRQGWGGLEDVLRHLPGTNFEKIEARSAKGGKSTVGSAASKVVLVYFIGGVTYSEIAALRFLGRQKGYRIIIATTAIINGSRMLRSFVETVK